MDWANLQSRHRSNIASYSFLIKRSGNEKERGCRYSDTCSDGTYYQATINGDPVEIIQDCSLCDIIRRAIEIYFTNFEPINCTRGRNNGGCGCGNLFGF